MKLWRLLLQHPDYGIRLNVLDENKAGSIHRKLFLYSKALFFPLFLSVIMVGILIVLQVSSQSLHPSSPYVLECLQFCIHLTCRLMHQAQQVHMFKKHREQCFLP